MVAWTSQLAYSFTRVVVNPVTKSPSMPSSARIHSCIGVVASRVRILSHLLTECV